MKKQSITSVFEFDKKMTNVIEGLSIDLGITMPAVLKRSIALLKVAQEAVNRGDKLILKKYDEDGNVLSEKRIILP